MDDTHRDLALAELSKAWPDWEFWIVPTAVGPDKWCARRRNDHSRVFNAATPEALTDQLTD